MTHFLHGQNEVVLAQTVAFEIPLNIHERDALSMLIFERDEASYISIMRQGDLFEGYRRTAIPGPVSVAGASIDQDGNTPPPPPPNPGGPGERYMYTVEVLFYIVKEMQEPKDEDFNFKFLSFANASGTANTR
jgi:hypothetical protein